MTPAKLGTAMSLEYGPVLGADGTPYTGALAYTDFQITKAGSVGALDASATATHKASDVNGNYVLALTANDISALGECAVNVNKATYCGPSVKLIVFPVPTYEMLFSLTQTSAGYIVAAFKKLFDVATPALTAASINLTANPLTAQQTRDAANLASAQAIAKGALAQTDAATGLVATGYGQAPVKSPATLAAGDVSGNVPVDVQTVKTQAVTCAAPLTVLASVGTASASTAQTGDSYAVVKAGGTGDLAALATAVAGLPAAFWAVATSALTGVGTIGKKLADWVIGTSQTGDVGTLITTVGASGAGLTALGDTRLAHLNADITSRSTLAAGAKMDLADSLNQTGVTDLKAKLGVIPASGDWNTVTPPSASANGVAAATAILATPANKLATDAAGKVTYVNAAPPSAADVRTEMDTNSTQLSLIAALAEADITIDTTTTPWEMVVKIKGTNTVLSTKKLYDSTGAAITAATQLVARHIEA